MSWQTGKKVKPVNLFIHEKWVDEAVCAQTDPDCFFPDKGESNAAAIAICKTCPVKDPCLNYALQHNMSGIWGATSENQRKDLRRQLGIRLVAEPIREHGTEAGARAHYRRGEKLCEACRRAANAAARQRA